MTTSGEMRINFSLNSRVGRVGMGLPFVARSVQCEYIFVMAVSSVKVTDCTRGPVGAINLGAGVGL